MIWTLKNYCLNLMQINMNFWSIYLRLNQRSWTPSELIKPSGLAIPLTVFTIDLKLITVHSSICYFVMNKKSVNKSEFINKWGTTNRRMHSISHDYAYGQSLWFIDYEDRSLLIFFILTFCEIFNLYLYKFGHCAPENSRKTVWTRLLKK